MPHAKVGRREGKRRNAKAHGGEAQARSKCEAGKKSEASDRVNAEPWPPEDEEENKDEEDRTREGAADKDRKICVPDTNAWNSRLTREFHR